MAITSSLITNKSKPCLFYRTKTEKYKLTSDEKVFRKDGRQCKESYIDMIKMIFN